MSQNKFQTAADIFDGWRDAVLSGKGPELYAIGEGALSQVPIGPGLVTLLGGAPGAGKTAFIMQGMIDALRLKEDLRVCVCNVEMAPSVLLDRQLSRLSGIDLQTVRHRQFTSDHSDRIAIGLATIEQIAERLCFVRPPFNLASCALAADAFKADVLVLDYLQRIAPPGEHADKRGNVDAAMNYLRQFAEAGIGIVAASAVGRTKDRSGRTSYDGDGLNLASFRESSELEFGADDAFILTPSPKDPSRVTLRHLKARHSEPKDIELNFDRARQSFTTLDNFDGISGDYRPNKGLSPVHAALAQAVRETNHESDWEGGSHEWQR